MDRLDETLARLKEEFQLQRLSETVADRTAGMKTVKSLRFHDLMTTRSFESSLGLLVGELALDLKVSVIAT